MKTLPMLSAKVAKKTTAPIKIMQFGEGNFLRAFVDWLIQKMNDSGQYEGHVVVVQPLPFGRVKELKEQDGLYTLILQGINEEGKAVRDTRLIDVLDDFVNPYDDYASFLHYGESKDLEVIVSNTTEAGICFEEKDVAIDLETETPVSFPGKLLALLKRRYDALGRGYGLAILPCELIDDNGDRLKEVLLRLAEARGMDEGFRSFLREDCHYTSTLVDRIVPGFPRDEFPSLCEEFGYVDNNMVKGEYFHLFVLKEEPYVEERFPVHKVGLHAIYVPDVHPYKQRKVRILNGSHTSLVPVAYLLGHDEVRESLLDPEVAAFLKGEIETETLPTVHTAGANRFASDVLDRFLNPYVHHALLSIALNSIPKFKERDLPIIEDDIALGIPPRHLVYALASLAVFYSGKRVKNGKEEEIPLKDSPENLAEMARLWDELEKSGNEDAFVTEFLGSTAFFGKNLAENTVIRTLFAKYFRDIRTLGPRAALEAFLHE